MAKKKVSVISLLSIILLIITCKSTFAYVDDKNRNFKSITIEDGLSQGSILSIMQDSKGYMWIGTHDGLNKYNGDKFKVYKYADYEEESISGNIVVDIEEDLNGDIWVGTTTGLSKIDSETNKVTTYRPNENGCTISHFRIREIMVSKNGEILVGTNDGLNIYDEEKDNFKRVYNSNDENNSLTNQEVSSMTEDINGDYWIGTKDGLNRIDKKTGEIGKYFSDEKDINSISFNHINSLYADDLGYLWIGTYYGGLNKLNLKTGEMEKFMPGGENAIPGALIKEIIRDSRGTVWVATDYGFAKLNESDNTFTTYNSNKYDSRSIISNGTLSLCEDRSGAIWVGTMDGISLFNPENLFSYYKSEPFNDNSLSSDLMSGIYEDNDGILWIGTVYDGLNIFDRENNKITRVDDKEDYEGEISISSNLVRKITGIDNEIWIATEGGLNKYDKDTGEITKYTSKDGLSCSDVKNLFIDKEGMLWIGTRDGIYSFDRKDTFTDYSKVFNDAGINGLNINDIYVDDDGIVWTSAGVEYGLISFNKKNNEIKTYNNFDKENSVYNTKYYNIICINSDDKDNIWLGTNSGLIKLNKKTGQYTKYTEKDGLPNNFIYGILFDEKQHLWVSTNYGISKFDESEGRFINYDSTDGIQGNEFNEFSYFKSKSGELFFGGTNGLTSFKPQNIREKNFTTPVEIESIYSNCGDIKIDDEINLDYKNNMLQFEFFMPDFRDTKKLIYAHKLTGLDKDWIVSDKVKSVSYSNLKPGKYVFEVAARNSSGEWSESTSVSISIEKPPWKTPFAYFVYLSLVIIFIYLIWNRVKILDSLVKQRTTELNNKLEENKELYSRLLKHEKYKNNYFINLSHELRTPLNIISATQNLIENLNEKNREIPKAKMSYYMQTINRNCGRLVNLIDNIMDTSKIETGSYKLNIKEHDIVYLVEEVALSMKELAYDKGIELIIEPYIEEKIIGCDSIEIERVIINLISNDIKFTDKGGIIEVFIWEIEECIKIVVKDNGIGIAPKNHQSIFDRFSQAYSETSEEHGGSGLGLTLSKQLIELHGGAIWVESELGNGSEFIIILPTKPNKRKEIYIC